MKSREVSFIRGLAIVGIVLIHTPWMFDDIYPTIPHVLSMGNWGCQAFFMLSAYCLCKYGANSDSSIKFWRRRFLSLAPGYWSTIAINIIISFFCITFIGHNLIPMDFRLSSILLNVFLLHGLSLSWGTMNSVAIGGWFVGTMMILYTLYPLLHKVYFTNNEIWRRIRFIAFPALIGFLCCGAMIISALDQESFCLIPSVKYFFFVNHLTAFAIGFALFDLEDKHLIQRPGFLFTLSFIITAIFYFGSFRTSNVITPILASTTTLLLFLFLKEKQVFLKTSFAQKIMEIGNQSYGIYLSHFWVCIIFPQVITPLLNNIGIDLSDSALYIGLLPIMLGMVYFISSAYNKWISFLKSRIAR